MTACDHQWEMLYVEGVLRRCQCAHCGAGPEEALLSRPFALPAWMTERPSPSIVVHPRVLERLRDGTDA